VRGVEVDLKLMLRDLEWDTAQLQGELDRLERRANRPPAQRRARRRPRDEGPLFDFS